MKRIKTWRVFEAEEREVGIRVCGNDNYEYDYVVSLFPYMGARPLYDFYNNRFGDFYVIRRKDIGPLLCQIQEPGDNLYSQTNTNQSYEVTSPENGVWEDLLMTSFQKYRDPRLLTLFKWFVGKKWFDPKPFSDLIREILEESPDFIEYGEWLFDEDWFTPTEFLLKIRGAYKRGM
jgi:hypothetical protein